MHSDKATHHVFPMTMAWAAMVLLVLAGMGGCATAPQLAPGVSAAANVAAAKGPVNPELAIVLGHLAKASNDKCKLAFLAGFKGLSAPAAKFNNFMGKSQHALLSQLQAWAHAHNVKLVSHHRGGLFGAAQKLQSAQYAHELLTSGGSTFEHLYLLLMYTDFSWQIQLDKAALEFKSPPVPLTYLHHALAINQQSRGMITAILFGKASK